MSDATTCDQSHRAIYSSTGRGGRAWEGSQDSAAGVGRERAGPQSLSPRETRAVFKASV